MPTPASSLSPRRPGAQLGNMNALKHGFYTCRLVETADPAADLYELAGILRTICLASGTITRVIKAQAFLANDPNDFYRNVDEAIRQVRLEMSLDAPPPAPETANGPV